MAVQSPKKSSALPWPALVPLGHHAGKPPISLQKMVIVVGSRNNAHLHLMSRSVSKAHALILSYGGSVYIRDLASREQVYVNGVPQREAWLKNNDLLKIGSFTFKYKDGPVRGGVPDAPPHDADLEVTGGDPPLAIAENVMLIGRRQTCDVSLIEASVSTAHAVLFHVGGKRYIRDLGSRTGTFVNGAKVHQQELNPGDEIRIGETDMRYTRASEHAHHIVPVDAETTTATEIDELEDLVGTAPLDMAAEIARDRESGTHDLDYDIGVPEPVKNDDLIELEIEHEPAAPAAPAAKTPPRPQPAPLPPPPLPQPEPATADGLEILAAEVEEPLEVEIDLSKDPDVADIPSAADTRAIGFHFEPEAPKPVVSEQVVDAPVGFEPDSDAGKVEEAPAKADEVGATWPDDLIPLDEAGGDTSSATPAAAVVDISPRGGWQGMSRADEAAHAEDAAPAVEDVEQPVETATEEVEIDELQPLELELPVEAVEEAPAAIEPVAEAPVVEEHILAEEPVVEEESAVAPVEEVPEIEEITEAPIELPVVELPAEEPAAEELPADEPVAEIRTVEAPIEPAPVAEIPAEEPVVPADEAPTDELVNLLSAETVEAIEAVVEEAPAKGRGRGRGKKKAAAEPKEPKPKKGRRGSTKRKAPVVEAPAETDAVAAGGAEAEQTPAAESEPVAAEAFDGASAVEAEEVSQTLAPEEMPTAQVAGEMGAADETAVSASAEAQDLSVTASEGVLPEEALSVVEAEAIDEARLVSELNAPAAPAEAPVEIVSEEAAPTTAPEPVAPVEEAKAEEAAVPEAGMGTEELLILEEAFDEIGLLPGAESEKAAAETSETMATPPQAPEAEAPERLADLDELREAEPLEPLDEVAELEPLDEIAEFEPIDEVVESDAPKAEEPVETPAVAEAAPVVETVEEDQLEEVAILDEEPADETPENIAESSQTEAPIEDTLPLLELDSADLAPLRPRRDPDELLALDQIDPDALDEVEVVEAAEPADESELDLDILAPSDTATSAQDPDSLTDTAFGRQLDEFTATSSGDIVEEELPELEGVAEAGDADEDLALALGGAEEPAPQTTPEPQASVVVESQDDSGVMELPADDVTAGGIEPAAMGIVTDETLVEGHEFAADGESVQMETPGIADATPVLEGQSFVVDASAAQAQEADSIELPSEELGDQSFTAHGEGQSVEQPVPQPPDVQHGGAGDGGGMGFIGTDLSSFIGGMPLVLPDLPPPPTGFGRVQVSFAGAKAPWEQAKRPAFPMGQGLAQEMMDAAEGLRDVEEMEEVEEQDAVATEDEEYVGEGEDSIHDDGAPADEWNVAAAFEDDEETTDDIVGAGTTTADETTLGEADVEEQLAEQMLELDEAPIEPEAPAAAAAVVESEPEAEAAPEPEPAAEVVDENDLLEELQADAPAEAEEEVSLDDLLAEMGVEQTEVTGPAVTESVDETAESTVTAEAPEAPAEEVVDLVQEEDVAELSIEGLEELSHEEPATDEPAVEAPTTAVEAPPAPAAPALPLPQPPGLGPIEELKLEDPPFEPPVKPARPGAIDQAIAELHLEEGGAADSVIDRSPPPSPSKSKAKPAPAHPTPPPPARGKLSRKAAASAAPAGDVMFGSVPPGKLPAAFAGMTGVREADVFSDSSNDAGAMGLADSSVFGTPVVDAPVPPSTRHAAPHRGGGGNGDGPTNGDDESHGLVGGGGARRSQRAIVPPRMGELGMGVSAVEAMEVPQPSAAYRTVPPKKNVARRVLIGVVIMIVCMILVVGGILYFLRPKLLTKGKLNFQNVGALNTMQRMQFQDQQFGRLNGHKVGLDARYQLVAKSIEPGFAADPKELSKVRVTWPPEPLGTMEVSYEGTDPKDRDRLYALLNALYVENAGQVDNARQLQNQIASLQKSIKEFQELKAKRQEIARQMLTAPSPEEIQQLETKARAAENQYDLAMSAVKAAQAELRGAEERLPAAAAGGGDGTNNKAANGPQGDPELASLTKAMEDAAAKLEAAKSSASGEADAKRKLLDQAIELFQQTAAGVAKESPELAQYVQAVQQLQAQTHKLSGDLIQVQQQYHERLSNWKKSLDEQVQAHRNEVWAADTGLADLRAQLDLATQKFNAFRDQGYAENSREVKEAVTEIQNLRLAMDARKATLGNDPIVSKFTAQLQEMINITKEQLEADRARTEKDIKEQEQAFARRNVVESLPETQRKQAEALKAKQEAINELRQQYAAALEKRSAESNAALRELEGQVSSIGAKVDERKRIIAAESGKTLTQQQEAARRAAIEQRQLALKSAEEQAATTLKLYLERDKALRAAMSRKDEMATARHELEALEQSLMGKEEQANQDALTLEDRQEQLKKLVTVVKPSEADVVQTTNDNNRWLYAFASVMGLAIVFGLGLVVSVSGGDRQAQRERYVEAGPMAIPAIGDDDTVVEEEETLTR